MKKTEYKKNKLVLMAFSIAILVFLLVAGTYAIFSTTIEPDKAHIITIGNLVSASADVTNNGVISLTNAVPLTDDQGLYLTDSTEVNIENIGGYALSYSIILLDDKEQYAADNDISSNILPDSVLKTGIIKDKVGTPSISLLSTKDQYCSDLSIANFVDCKNDEDASYGKVIATGKLELGDKVKYDIHLWVDYVAGNVYQNRHYHGQIIIVISQDDLLNSAKPIITLKGDMTTEIMVGENYADQGFLSAIDAEDGDVSDTVTVVSNLNNTVPGVYYVLYSAHDSSGYYGYALRNIIVNPSTTCGITFTINGNNPYYVFTGTTYSDPGATAVDENSNSLTVTSNSAGLDMTNEGTYQIIYSATVNSCTQYTSRVVEVVAGTDKYMVYSPNGTNNQWVSSSTLPVSISVAEDAPYVTPQTLKYKVGTIDSNNEIVYGTETTFSGLSGTHTFDTSGVYIFSSTIIGLGDITLSNLNSKIYKYDNVAPSCGASYSGNPGLTTPRTWTNQDRVVTITSCTDAHSGCKSSSLMGTFTTTAQTGTITISDNASPANTTDCLVDVYVDKTNPICGAVSGDSTTWSQGTRNVSVACSDEDSGCIEGTFSNEFANTTSARIGYIDIVDNANNLVTCPVNVYLDNGTPVAPTITGNIASNTWTDGDVTLTISGSSSTSGIAGYAYCIASTNNTDDCTWTEGQSLTITTEGTFYVFAKAKNNANKYGNPSVAYIVNIDRTAPTCTITASGATIRISNAADSNGSGLDASPYSWNGTSYSTTATIAASDKTSYTGYVKDMVGNIGTCGYTCTAWGTPATNSVSSCTGYTYYNSKVTCSGSYYRSQSGSCTCNNCSYITGSIGGTCNGTSCKCSSGCSVASNSCKWIYHYITKSTYSRTCSAS